MMEELSKYSTRTFKRSEFSVPSSPVRRFRVQRFRIFPAAHKLIGSTPNTPNPLTRI